MGTNAAIGFMVDMARIATYAIMFFQAKAVGFEMGNQGKSAGGRKSAWSRLKRQDPTGITPRGLALIKNR